MRLGFAALAAAFIGALTLGAAPGMANEVSKAPVSTATYESGFVATQGRGRGGGRGFRAGGGGRGFVARGGGRRNFGRNVGIGVGALVLGGIIASQATRAQGGGGSCRRWSYECDRGSGRACRALDQYC